MSDKILESKELDEAIRDYERAIERYKTCSDDLSLAQRNETEALNNLNRAQKKLEAIYQTMREKAPRRSDWARQVQEERAIKKAV